jgi:UDP-N-acetylmuramate dehydrogenase
MAEDGRAKIPAAWLIERAGFAKGLRRGAVGISSAHALALVHHGGGSTRALVALANEIGEAVLARFGVALGQEPIFIGPAAAVATAPPPLASGGAPPAGP